MSNDTIKSRYTIIGKPIAKGGFGIVFKAKDKFDDKAVALKEIDTSGIEIEEAFRISQEAITLATLNHENIIKYYDSCYENQRFYIITEFCDKRRLFHAIIEPKLITSEDKVKKWLAQSLDALKYIHQRNIYHRDIKPMNIFISTDNIKIGDFGISITVSKIIYALSLFGSELYRAPEILRGETYDSKSDIWALGVTFYELCSFKTPYRSEADIVNNTSIDKIDNYSETFNEILKKMLSYQQTNRLSALNILEFYFQKAILNESNNHKGHTYAKDQGINSFNCIKIIENADQNWISCLQLLPNDVLVSGSYDKSLKFWYINSFNCIKTIENAHKDYIICLQSLPNDVLVSGSYDKSLKFWNINS